MNLPVSTLCAWQWRVLVPKRALRGAADTHGKKSLTTFAKKTFPPLEGTTGLSNSAGGNWKGCSPFFWFFSGCRPVNLSLRSCLFGLGFSPCFKSLWQNKGLLWCN